MLDSSVAEVISKLVSNPKFSDLIRSKINMEVDTSALDQEIANYEKQGWFFLCDYAGTDYIGDAESGNEYGKLSDIAMFDWCGILVGLASGYAGNVIIQQCMEWKKRYYSEKK